MAGTSKRRINVASMAALAATTMAHPLVLVVFAAAAHRIEPTAVVDAHSGAAHGCGGVIEMRDDGTLERT
ncbi:MAG TPA: hypothetical protein VII84_06850 [Acidimicrobiales bacterium]